MRKKMLGRFTLEGIEWTAFVKDGALCVRPYGKPRMIRSLSVEKAVELCIANGQDSISPQRAGNHPEFLFQ